MSRLLPRALLLVCLAPSACAVAQPKPPPLGGDYIPERLGPTGPYAVPVPRPAPAPAPTPQSAAGLAKPPPLPPGADPFQGGARRTVSSGTGFVVAPGRVLTNAHVVESCTALRIRTTGGQEFAAMIGPRDAERDLALVSVAGGELGPPLGFRAGPEMRRGDGVVTYGFPLAGLLGSGPTLTTGDISALSGLRDNQAQFQISAPVQPGNSGGPLFDMGGNVVGVVTSKLNAQRIAQSTGDIPQNVNFAIKGQEALAFLRQQGVQPRIGTTAANLGAAEVGEIAHPSTVFLRCTG